MMRRKRWHAHARGNWYKGNKLAGPATQCAHCLESRVKLYRDHIKPIALGGQTTESNMQWLCSTCHITKTREDMAMIRKHKETRICPDTCLLYTSPSPRD